MFVSFIQFIFDPYLDQFEARPGVASVAWLKIQVIVLSLTLSLSLIQSSIISAVSDGMFRAWDRD